MIRRTWIASAAATLAAPLVAPGAAAEPLAVQLGTSPTEAYAQPFYAKEAGIFAQNGIDAQIQLLGTGAAVSAALAGGAIDVGVGTVVGTATAIQRGIPFVMIAPAELTTAAAPTALLCVEKSSAIQSAKDLVGKTIAVPSLKQIVDLALLAWFEKNGVDSSTVQLIEVHFSDMAPGLDRGTFAAAMISEPSLSDALTHGSIRSIGNPYLAIGPQYSGAGWITTQSYRQKNPATVRKVAASLMAAARWANGHRDQTAQIVSNVTKVPVATIEHESRTVYAESMQQAHLQLQLDTALKFGYITRPMTAAQLLGQA